MTASVLEKATFSQLCKLMGKGDDTVKQFVRGALRTGLLGAVGLLGSGVAVAFGEGALWVGEILTFAANTGNGAAYAADKIVAFFQEKAVYSAYEKAQLAHILMVFSAYFDTLQTNMPQACQAIELTGEEKERFVRYAQERSWDEDLAHHDLFLPTNMEQLPKSYDGLEKFYEAMTEKLRKFITGLRYVETLPGQDRDHLNALLLHLPYLATQTYKDQLISLSETSKTFLVYNLFGALGEINQKLDNVGRNVEKLLGASQTSAVCGYGLPVLPDPSDGFLPQSRDTELNTLETLLQSRNTLFIFGVGGIGKTETAIQLGIRFGNAHLTRFSPPTTPGQQAVEKLILDLVIDNYCYSPSRENMDESQRRNEDFLKRLQILKTHFSGHLLIVDSFDCPGRTLDQLRGEESFRKLEKCGLKLIFTTRYCKGNHPGVEIQPLNQQQLLCMMRRYTPSSCGTDAQLNDLIEAVGRHTLTCVLMAKTLGDSWTDVTPEQLLQAIRDARLDQLAYPQVINDQNREWENRRIYGHLKALFDLSGMSSAHNAVLLCATLLPAGGMELKLVRACLPEGLDSSLKALVDTGWITLENELLSLHPVIREVCREELKPDNQKCGTFLTNLWSAHNPKEYDVTRYLCMAECFASAGDTLTDDSGEWASNAAYFYFDLGNFTKALHYDLKALELKLRSGPENVLDHGDCYHNIGMTYANLGQHKSAMEYLLKALNIYRNELPQDDDSLAQFYNNIGFVYGCLGKYETALEYQLKAMEKLLQNQYSPDHPVFAPIYNYLGSTYDCLGKHDTALDYHKKALDIRIAELPADHPRVAQPCNDVGISYRKLGQYDEALEYLNRAVKIRENAGLWNHPDLAHTYNELGITYTQKGDYDLALEFQQKALRIQKDALPPQHSDYAATCNNMGIIYGKQGDYEKSLEYHLEDLSISEAVLGPEHPDLAITYNNVGFTYDELGKYPEAVKYLKKALAIQKKSLRPYHSDLARSHNNIGIIYSNLKNWKQAKAHLRKALEIYEHCAAEDFPDFQICRRNYEQICGKQS